MSVDALMPGQLGSAFTPTPASEASLAVVIGLGRSGQGAARLLHAQGHPVCVLESSQAPQLEERARTLQDEGIDVHLGVPLDHTYILAMAPRIGPVIISPGIRWDHPELELLRNSGVTIHGELVPAWRTSRPQPWIGITGTNGKTTVTHLVSHLLISAGINAPMAGNVGQSVAELVLEQQGASSTPTPWLVVEMSSYQIEANPDIAPRVGIWTTLTPDHLERHGTLDHYRAIKRSLLKRSAIRVLNGDDPDLRGRASTWDRAVWVTASENRLLTEGVKADLWISAGRVWVDRHGEVHDLLAADALAMPGAHNLQNMLLAVAAALEAGLDGPTMESALRSFPGVPHRLERIRVHRGVHFFNDSKATNYDAAEVALKALDGPLVVLAGGQAKIGDGSGWIEALQQKAKSVVLYGEARDQFAGLLQQSGFQGSLDSCVGLEEAVPLADCRARKYGCNTVLLSPACASFDQYTDFEARGEHFRRLVQAL